MKGEIIMFTHRKNRIELDKIISELIEDMKDTSLTEEQRYKIEERLETLINYRNSMQDKRATDVWLPKVISGVFGLVSVFIILNYEKEDVITSKSFGVATRMMEG